MRDNARRVMIFVPPEMYEIFVAQAREECRPVSVLMRYATLQYCKSYPAKVDGKKIFNKFHGIPQIEKPLC